MSKQQWSMETQKLYTVVRADFSHTQQLVQTASIISQFAVEHPKIHQQWYSESGCLVCLSCPSSSVLLGLYDQLALASGGVYLALGLELGLDDQGTALAVYGDQRAIKRVLSRVPAVFEEKEDQKWILGAMRGCYETKYQNIFEHGEQVYAHFMDLYEHLEWGRTLKYVWKLPEWLMEHKEAILDCLESLEAIKSYQLHRDCGKPFCMTVSSDGRKHFPNYAKISSGIWLATGGSKIAAHLMLMDRIIPTIKTTQYAEFAARDEAWTLWLTDLAEIHTEADQLGGLDYNDFKIKYRRLEKLGRYMITTLSSI